MLQTALKSLSMKSSMATIIRISCLEIQSKVAMVRVHDVFRSSAS